MNRRQFLEKCFRLGGYAGIAGLGLSAVRDARAWGILPSLPGSSTGGTTFADWNQYTESGWGDSSVFICVAEGTGAGDNEEGQGAGIVNPNTILTEIGNIPGAVGSGAARYRALDGANHYFSVQATLTDLVKSQTKWMIAHKFSHITQAQNDQFIQLEAAVATNAQLVLRIKGLTGELEIIYNEDNVGQEILATANVLDFGSSTYTWIGVHADGTNNVRFWHHNSNTPPSSWDAIAAGDKATLATAGLDGTINFSFSVLNLVSGTSFLNARWYATLISCGKTLWE